MSAKAIETLYKGHRFRSRLEARWAVFLDAIKTPWEYEKEGYELPSGRYLPDFWLPELHAWMEVKPGSVVGDADDVDDIPSDIQNRCEHLAEGTDSSVIVAIGLPPGRLLVFTGDTSSSSSGVSWWGLGRERVVWAIDNGRKLCLRCWPHQPQRTFHSPDHGHRSPLTDDVWADARDDVTWELAATAAKSARFEYGQCGT